jgi:lipoprotein-releasing system permease protein
MAERSPHLTVEPERGNSLPDPDRVRRALRETPGVVAVEPVIEGRAWVAPAAGGAAMPVRYRNASDLSASGEAPPPVRLAAAVAVRVGAGNGEPVRLTSSRTRLSPIGPIPISVVLSAADLPRRGALEKAPDAEVPESVARMLAGEPEGARAYEAVLADPGDVDRIARLVAARLPAGCRIETWREKNAPLSFALRLEKLVIFATVALVILVAAFNVVSNVSMLVVEKKKDLGVLTTMGAAPRSLAKIYLALGATIGAIGTAIGLALGVGISITADRYQLVPLPGDVYLFSHVPFAVHPREVAIVAVFAFATAVAAALLPARAASRLAPGEALGLSR